MSSSKQKGPNYALIGGLGVAGAALGAGLGQFVLKVGTPETAGLAVLGLLVSAGIGLIPSSGGDAKRLATQAAVKKDVDSAYQAQALGRLDQSEKLLLGVLEKGQTLGQNDVNLLAARHSLANLYRLKNQPEKAEEAYKTAIAQYEALALTSDANFASCLRDCALVLETLQQNEPSLTMARRSLGIFEQLNQTREICELMSLMGRNLRATGQLQPAIDTYQKVKDIQIKQYGEHSPEVVETQLTVARCLRDLEKPAEALDAYKDVLGRVVKAERPNRLDEAESLLEMAEFSLAQGSFKNVEPLCVGSLKVLQTYVGPREKLLVRIATAVKEARQKLNVAFSETDFIWLFTQNRDQVRDLFRAQPELAKQVDRTGWGSIQWTLFLGWDDLMRWLMRNGGQKDGFEANVMSPVHVCSAWSKGGNITFMAENEVPLDVVGPLGWSPVHYAAYHGRQDVMEQLLARGVEKNRLEQNGRSALHLAADRGHNDMVTLLLSKELDKNLADTKYKRTPLHYAAASGFGATVRNLMMNGANESATDVNGKTPIDLAEANGHRGLAAAMRHFRQAMEG
jgi:tetratricopeptide (TPR) repeat protein